MLPVSGTALLYLKAPDFWPFAQSDKSNKESNKNMEHGRNNIDRRKSNYSEKACPNAVLSTTIILF